MSFWSQLKERKLVQWMLAYTAFGIAILEILNAVETPFLIPSAVVRVCMVVVGVGFFVTVVLAWFHGERGHQRVTVPELALLLAIVLVGSLAGVMAARPEAAEKPPIPAAQGLRLPATAAERNSIAVLPFRNLSGSSQDDYFSDGVSEELTNALGELPGLRVASRTSAFQYKGSNLDIRQIGGQLGVAAVLEGSVQHAGDRLRISARLVDAGSGYQIWQERIDANAADIFAAEDSISRSVARALQVKLALATTPTENARPMDPVAHQTYLKAQYYAKQTDPDSVRMAQSQYREAARRDPRFAPAWAGLAESFMTLGRMGVLPRRVAMDSARRIAARAMHLDSTLPDAHFVMARASDDLSARQDELQKTLQLNPNDVDARAALAEVMAAKGEMQAAAAQLRDLKDWDRSPRGRENWRRIEFMVAPQPPGVGAPPMPPMPPGAVEVRVPAAAAIYGGLCDRWAMDPAMIRLGNAASECQTARRMGANDPAVLRTVALAFARLGQRDAALDALRAAERMAPGDTATVTASAAVHAALGDLDAAFAVLKGEDPARLRAELDDPRLAPLRADPRFAELQHRARG